MNIYRPTELMKILLKLLVLIAATIHATYVNAHHSRANFHLDQTQEILGQVTEFTFRSPHAWITVEASDQNGNLVSYTIEGGSVGSLRRFGWDKNSLAVGDFVRVVGNPDRNPKNHLLYLSSVEKSDGTVLRVTGEPVIAAKKLKQEVKPSTDFSGIWSRVATQEYFNRGAFRAPTDWPLNEKGKAMVDGFDMKHDPMVNCTPTAMPRYTYTPFRHRWTREGDLLMIERELSPLSRQIDLTGREFPDEIEPSRMGYSLGQIDEQGTLIIETKGFVYDPWGNTKGLDSSEQKQIIEKYRLAEDGLSMTMELSVYDPVFMTEPHVVNWKFVKGPDFNGDLGKQDCDPESAGRHLKFE